MPKSSTQARDHGWGPYWLPMLAFLVLVEIGRRVPAEMAPLFPVLKVAVPLALFVYFVERNAYPELRGFHWSPMVGLDVLVGLAGAALWMGPYILFDGVRPEEPGFDPRSFGADGVWLALTVRGVGYSCVTPFVEELFVRSWLLRYLDVFDKRRDFRSVPIAQFSWRSFLIVTVYFVFSHADWEWGVMFLWTLLTMAWFYYRKHIVPLLIVHTATNSAIFAAVVLLDETFLDAAGDPISLWFFL